jgi:hypothetical protein
VVCEDVRREELLVFYYSEKKEVNIHVTAWISLEDANKQRS